MTMAFSELYVKSQPALRVISCSYVQRMRKQYGKTDDEQAYAILVESIEGDNRMVSSFEGWLAAPNTLRHIVFVDSMLRPFPSNASKTSVTELGQISQSV